MIADRDIWVTENFGRACEADDPERWCILARIGNCIPQATVIRYGLQLLSEMKAEPEPLPEPVVDVPPAPIVITKPLGSDRNFKHRRNR